MSILNEPLHGAGAPLISSRFGFPVREDVALSNNKGEAKPGIEKDFKKLADKLAGPLQRMLAPGETVFWISKAFPPLGALEQLTMGWLMLRYYNAALVLTERRLLIFQLTASNTWRGTVKSIRWDQMQSVKVGGFLSRTLTFKVGKQKYIYSRLGVGNSAKIKTIVAAITANPSAGIVDPMSPGLESLCPRCTKPLTAEVFTCQNCGLVFKDLKTLAIRTLIPGGAYFYCGMGIIGVLHGLAETFILLVLAVTVFVPQPAAPNDPPVAVTVGVELFFLCLWKAVAFFHARRFIREFEPVNLAEVEVPGTMAAGAK